MQQQQIFYQINQKSTLSLSLNDDNSNGNNFRVYPSVTTVLGIINKPGINNWEKREIVNAIRKLYKSKPETFKHKLDEEKWFDDILEQSSKQSGVVLREAAKFGTEAHKVIDDSILKVVEEEVEELEPDLSLVPPHLKNVKMAFLEFQKKTGVQLEMNDTMVWSDRYGYAGSFDSLARKPDDGSLVVLDWKTSNFISTEYSLQLSAYANAIQELTGETVSEGWIVKFHKKNPTFEVKVVKSLDSAFNAFKNALQLWSFYNSNSEFYTDLYINNNNNNFVDNNNNSSSVYSEESYLSLKSHNTNYKSQQQKPPTEINNNIAKNTIIENVNSEISTATTQTSSTTNQTSSTSSTTTTTTTTTTQTTQTTRKPIFTVINKKGKPLNLII
eukprot:gene466-590_t